MAIRVKKMVLNKMELLSLVDAGASGDDRHRPAIVLYKRKTRTSKMLDMVKKFFSGKKIDLEKMGLSDTVGALDELGLNPEQMAGVLKVIEAFAAPTEASKPEPEPEVKAEDKPAPTPEDEKEKEELAKRAKEHQIELAKRDKRIQKLEDDAQTLRLEKRADDLGFLPDYSRTETIDLLKRAEKLGKDEYDKIDTMLGKVAKASKDSPLLRAAGAVAHEDENSASVRLAKRVKVLQDKDPELPVANAKNIVYENDPELFSAVKAEVNAAR